MALRLLTILLCLLAATPGLADARRGRPRTPGGEAIVLPGFAPLERSGTRIQLGPRSYAWDRSFLPATLESLGSPIAGPMSLRLRAGGEERLLAPTSVRARGRGPHQVVMEARGRALPQLKLKVTTRVEYDGVAQVTLTLKPTATVEVDGLDFEVDVVASPATRALRFQSADIRVQRRDQALEPSYAGPFLNAVGIADGDRSFWWFADDAQGWIWNGDTVTELASVAPDRLRLRQRLIGERYRIERKMTLRMNFLVTPVRDLGSAWRRERLTAGASREEGEVALLQGAWSTAFAHTALPFTEPPADVLGRIPAADLANYPGLATNRFYLERNLENKGIHSLPYFSAHCLSELDPTLERNRAAWEVDPPFVVLSSVSSYPTQFEKPVLSHRAPGYADYVLARMNEEIDKLGMSGLYLDHASIMDSRSPAHGAWVDSNGQLQPATDILGMRQYLKRLRTLFHRKGKPGYLLVHASNGELIPAYTFATAIVDGEQFRHRLVGDDYIASVPLDQVRMQNAPGQYGVRNVWVPQFDHFHGDDPGWPESAVGRAAFRNLLTLVLLHDGEFWPNFVAQSERLPLLQALDAFGVAEASFTGYWSPAVPATTSRALARVSTYQRPGALLLVVGNLSSAAESVDVAVDLAAAGLPADATAQRVPEGDAVPLSGGLLSLSVPARDFRLVELK